MCLLVKFLIVAFFLPPSIMNSNHNVERYFLSHVALLVFHLK